MASQELSYPDRFPPGTTVSVYLRSDQPPADPLPDQNPSGSVVTTGVSDNDGIVVLNGLTENTRYVAYALVGGKRRFVSFVAEPAATGGVAETDSIALGQKGLGNGIATLDSSALVPNAQTPGRYRGLWQATTAYKVNDIVTAPSGQLVAANANFTSGGSFNASNWANLSQSMETDVKAFGAKNDAKKILDFAMTAGSPVITSPTAPFTSTAVDGGKQIYAYGLAASGSLLQGTILSVQSTTQATLSVNCGTTGSGKVGYFGTDDSTAINNAVQGGAPVVNIVGSTLIHAAGIMHKEGVFIRGAGAHQDADAEFIGPFRVDGFNAATTLVALGGSGSFIAIDSPSSARGFGVDGMSIVCRKSTAANDSRTAGAIGIRINTSCQQWRLTNIDGAYGSNGIVIENGAGHGHVDAHWREARCHNLIGVGSCNTWDTSARSLFQVVNAFGVATAPMNPANVALVKSGTAIPNNIRLNHLLQDETGLATDHACYYLDACDNVSIHVEDVYPPTNGYGIYVGPDCQDLTIRAKNIRPWTKANAAGDRTPKNTIFIDPAATRIFIEDTTTDPVGAGGVVGGDISDTGGVARYRNVNGQDSVKTKGSAPVAADFAGLPTGIVRGPILNTVDSKLYYLMADGTTVKSSAALA